MSHRRPKPHPMCANDINRNGNPKTVVIALCSRRKKRLGQAVNERTGTRVETKIAGEKEKRKQNCAHVEKVAKEVNKELFCPPRVSVVFTSLFRSSKLFLFFLRGRVVHSSGQLWMTSAINASSRIPDQPVRLYRCLSFPGRRSEIAQHILRRLRSGLFTCCKI